MAGAGRGNKFSKAKYEERILNEINYALRKEFADSRLTRVSVTHVELSQDYSMAKVYWDTFDAHTRGDAKTAIESIAGRMRSLLANKLSVKHVPEIRFFYNSQFEDEHKITQLLNKASDEEE